MTRPQQDAFQQDYNAFGISNSASMSSTPSGQSGLLPNIVTQQLRPSGLASGQTLQQLKVNKLIIGGGKEITITPQDSIQQAMDEINEAGGGILYLSNGTYKVPGALTGYTSVSIKGTSITGTILDFQSTSANLTFTGSNIYSTGTLTSITSGVSVIGSGTSWLANVQAGYYIFIGTRWYLIAAVIDDTHITLAEGFTDTSITFPGAAYRTGQPVLDVTMSDLTVKNSTGTALIFTDARYIHLQNIDALTSNKGIVFTNASHLSLEFVLCIGNTSNGIELTNAGLSTTNGIAMGGNGGHGMVMNNINTFPLFLSTSTANTGDGYNCTSVISTIFDGIDSSGNGGQGFEFVSGCNNNFVSNTIVRSNGSDGIKLTATSDNNTLGGTMNLVSNGGYGINIAASTNDNNTLLSPYFESNTSGTYNDSGTGTIIIGRGSLQEGFFGDGNDGSATLDGTATVAWASKSGDTYTMTRDAYLTNLTVNTGKTLIPNGYKIFINNTLTNAGTIHMDGGAGGNSPGLAGGTAGAANGSGTVSGGLAGKAGGTGGTGGAPTGNGSNGTAGTAASFSLGSNGAAGGAGGTGDSGATSGGTAGAAGAATAAVTFPRNIVNALSWQDLKTTYTATSYYSASAGSGSGSGGGGASGGAQAGGGGGSGATGGTLWIAAITLTNSGTISANGGAGGSGGNAPDNNGGGGGGGGGGNGGVVFLMYASYINTGTVTATAGAAGAAGNKQGTGVNGSAGAAGAAGSIIQLQN